MSIVKKMVEELISSGYSKRDALAHTASTLDMSPADVERECNEAEEDELREEDPPVGF
jgi:hypothetical protein